MIRKVLLVLIVLFWSTAALAQYPIAHPARPNCHTFKAKGDQEGCLACAVFYEAKSEPLAGKLAVALVTVNRTRSDKFDNRSVCTVLWEKGQYPWSRRKVLTPDNKEQWADARLVAATIYELSKQDDYPSWDFTRNSMFFHATSVSPGWRFKRTMKLHNHIFYGFSESITESKCVQILGTHVGACK